MSEVTLDGLLATEPVRELFSYRLGGQEFPGIERLDVGVFVLRVAVVPFDVVRGWDVVVIDCEDGSVLDTTWRDLGATRITDVGEQFERFVPDWLDWEVWIREEVPIPE